MKKWIFGIIMMVLFAGCEETKTLDAQHWTKYATNCWNLGKKLNLDPILSDDASYCEFKSKWGTHYWVTGPNIEGALKGITLQEEVLSEPVKQACVKACEKSLAKKEVKEFNSYFKCETKCGLW